MLKGTVAMLESIAKIIVDYGLVVLLMSLVIYGAILLIKATIEYIKKLKTKEEENQKKEGQKQLNDIKSLELQKEELTKILQASHREMLSTIQNLVLGETEDHSKLSNQEMNIKIHELLDRTLKEADADRVSLFMFHNGGQDMLGRNFQKMSCTNQCLRNGIASSQGIFQNCFQSTFLYALDKIIQNSFWYQLEMEDLKVVDFSIYDILTSVGIRSAFCQALYNKDGACFGFLSLSYLKASEESDVERLLGCVQINAHRLEGLL